MHILFVKKDRSSPRNHKGTVLLLLSGAVFEGHSLDRALWCLMNYASQFTIQSVHGYGRFEKRVSSEVKMLCYMYSKE